MADESSLEQLLLSAALEGRGPQWVQRVLAAVRVYLGMDVAFVSQFCGSKRVFRFVDAAPDYTAVQMETGDALDETYCQRIVDGRLPEVIHNTLDVPQARELSITRRLSIRANIGVPLRFSDGSVYGTFSCFSTREDPSLRERDVSLMRVLASLLAEYLETEGQEERRRAELSARILSAVEGDALTMVFHPILNLRTRHAVGYEALARFPGEVEPAPSQWFTDAGRVGLTVELELAAIRAGLTQLARVPDDAFLAVKATPATIISPRLPEALGTAPRGRIVIELTERSAIECFADLSTVFEDYRRTGLRFAVDDTGAGYSTFRHILWLRPDIIKLDRSLTRDVGQNPAHQALVRALMWLAEGVEASVVAKGIETEAELQALESFGIRHGQGFLLARPAPLPEPPPEVPLTGVRARRAETSRSRRDGSWRPGTTPT